MNVRQRERETECVRSRERKIEHVFSCVTERGSQRLNFYVRERGQKF